MLAAYIGYSLLALLAACCAAWWIGQIYGDLKWRKTRNKFRPF